VTSPTNVGYAEVEMHVNGVLPKKGCGCQMKL
jgi:hypothetical protein